MNAPHAHVSENLAMMPIQHFMTRKPIYATPSSTIRIAMQMMLTHKVSGLPVVDNNECCVGVYSEMDAMLQAASHSLDAKIEFTKSPKMILPDMKFRDVLIAMVQKKLKRLPVVDKNRVLIGIVSRRDLMRAFFEGDKKASNP